MIFLDHSYYFFTSMKYPDIHMTLHYELYNNHSLYEWFTISVKYHRSHFHPLSSKIPTPLRSFHPPIPSVPVCVNKNAAFEYWVCRLLRPTMEVRLSNYERSLFVLLPTMRRGETRNQSLFCCQVEIWLKLGLTFYDPIHILGCFKLCKSWEHIEVNWKSCMFC